MPARPILPIAAACLVVASVSAGAQRRVPPAPAPPSMVRIAPPVPAPPPLPAGATPARPLNPLWSLVTPDDYPVAALRAQVEGRVDFELFVSIGGRAIACIITGSSGSIDLDAATCRIMRARAWFEPARSPSGRALPDRLRSAITWQLEDEPEPAEGASQQ